MNYLYFIRHYLSKNKQLYSGIKEVKTQQMLFFTGFSAWIAVLCFNIC